jgi:hypothetical protein
VLRMRKRWEERNVGREKVRIALIQGPVWNGLRKYRSQQYGKLRTTSRHAIVVLRV